MIANEQWETLAQAYAFLGNSLLAPMTQTGSIGLDPAFWEAFPDCGSAEARAAADGMSRCVRALLEDASARLGAGAGEAAAREEAALRASVEYTHLFIGPPRPAAAPWETFYRGAAAGGGQPVGFGEATFAMRSQLRELGLELRNENNQYEDHLGIELLCLSELCSRAADGRAGQGEVAGFIRNRPLGWVGAFRDRIASERPDGYFAGIVSLAAALLRWNAEAVEA